MDFYIENNLHAVRLLPHLRYLEPYPHLHSHIEIVYMRRGTATGYINGTGQQMEDGDVFVVFPNQIHYYDHIPGSSDTALFMFSPDLFSEFWEIFKNYLPTRTLLKKDALPAELPGVLEALAECDKKEDPYIQPRIRGNALVLFSILLHQLDLQPNSINRTGHAQDIINYCNENFTTNISLQSIADALLLSRNYISRLFRQNLKVGFSEYINALRINKACALLRSEKNNITEIAYQVGFNSLRSFNRCFKAAHKVTPTEYRAQVLLLKTPLSHTQKN